MALRGAGRLDDDSDFNEALRLEPNLPDAHYDLQAALAMKNTAEGRLATPP